MANMVANRLSPNCCKGVIEDADTDCAQCDGTPKFMQVVVGGTLADQDCTECENIPATYICEQVSACTWRCNICNCDDTDPQSVPTTSNVSVLQNFSGGTYKLIVQITVEITSTNATDIADYRVDKGATKPNCKSYSNESLTFDSLTDGSVCGDWSSLTVTVSAINGPADDESQCPLCDWQTMPDDWTGVINSLTDDTGCDCSDTGNATVARTFNDTFGCCRWQGTYIGDCGQWRYTVNMTDTTLTCVVANDLGLGGSVTYTKAITTPIDCSVAQTLTYSSGSFSECNNESSSTVTLTPV